MTARRWPDPEEVAAEFAEAALVGRREWLPAFRIFRRPGRPEIAPRPPRPPAAPPYAYAFDTRCDACGLVVEHRAGNRMGYHVGARFGQCPRRNHG